MKAKTLDDITQVAIKFSASCQHSDEPCFKLDVARLQYLLRMAYELGIQDAETAVALPDFLDLSPDGSMPACLEEIDRT